MPYESYSHRQTHIAHLHMLGRVYGLDPPDFRRARVLELGCGGGGNIIPVADQYRDSRFVGIDLSPVQIGQGRELAAALGLDNIDLRVELIMDVGASGDPFDYIVCHGTFSWVPQEAREKILAIVRDRLSPNGLAVVSYNALPGWIPLRGLREMMMYHASFFATPGEKVAQARELLRLIIDGQGASQSFYRTMLEGEQAALRPKRDYYIFHEYLEPDNQAFYLQEFAAMAAKADLAYLCDADPGVAFLGNYTDAVSARLAQIDDPIRREQYLDFIANRRFRASLLTRRKDAARAPGAARLGEFWLCGQLRPAGPEPPLPLAAKPNLVFTGPGEVRFTAYDRSTAAMFLTLWHVKRAADPRRAHRRSEGAIPARAARLRAAGLLPGRRLAPFPGARPDLPLGSWPLRDGGFRAPGRAAGRARPGPLQ